MIALGPLDDAALFGAGGPLEGLDNPAGGDFARIRSAGQGFDSQASVYRSMADAIGGAETLLANNVSQATTVVAGRTTLLRDRLGVAATTLEHYSNTFETYAVLVEQIVSECAVVKAAIAVHLLDIEDAANTIERALDQSVFGAWLFRWDAVPDTPDRLASAAKGDASTASLFDIDETDARAANRARGVWSEAVVGIRAQRQLWEALIGRRSQADLAAVQSFGDLPVFDAAGIPAPGGAGSRLGIDYAAAILNWSTLDGASFENAHSEDPDRAIDSLTAMSVAQVAGLWAGLSAAFRRALIERNPERIGTLAGVAPTDRDAANVLRLPALYAAAVKKYKAAAGKDGPRSYEGDPGMADAGARMQALKLLVNRYGEGSAKRKNPPEYLITLDASGPGAPLAAAAVGHIDTATNVSYLVPGMNSSVFELPDYARAAERLHDTRPDRAVVVWLNYESPGPLDVSSSSHALAGAERLRDDLAAEADRTRATTHGTTVSVIGHSYGTTVATIALAGRPLGVDNLLLVGSAGVPDDITAAQINVAPDRIFASQADADALASMGQAVSGRSNPEHANWGAQTFGVDGTTLPDGTILDPVEAHNAVGATELHDERKYFGQRTESLYNIGRILDGADVTPGDRVDPLLKSPYVR